MKEEYRKRLTGFIEQDRDGLNRESRAAALEAFRHVAEEFFEPAGEIDLDVAKERHGFEVTLRFRADRVKNFTSIK